MDEFQGACFFERIDPRDLVGAMRSCGDFGRGVGVAIRHPGDGVDQLVAWAIADITAAMSANAKTDALRHAANAILHARRALSCLIDWYVRRDHFDLCRNAPTGAKDKTHILLARGILDQLTASVLARAAAKRDVVEHGYKAPSIDDSQDVVELVRRVTACLMSDNAPFGSPSIFGNFSFGTGWSNATGANAHFNGWHSPLFAFWRHGGAPWLGVVVPESGSSDHASVRFCSFRDISTDLMLEVLGILEEKHGRATTHHGEEGWQILGEKTGFSSLVETSNARA